MPISTKLTVAGHYGGCAIEFNQAMGGIMKHSISTIGYEGATVAGFVATLKHASINLLIDVRDLPLSRKRGFSKNQLAEILMSSGIEYVHLKGLGDPREGRMAARAGDYGLFKKIFGKHLGTDLALKHMDVAAELVRDWQACLMCFEYDPTQCHRSIVAGKLAQMTGLTVAPLAVQNSRITRIAA